MVDGEPVEPACNRLLLVQARCVEPRCDLGFDLRIIRPTIRALRAVGAKEPAGRVGTVDAKVGINKHLPATLAGRRFCARRARTVLKSTAAKSTFMPSRFRRSTVTSPNALWLARSCAAISATGSPA